MKRNKHPHQVLASQEILKRVQKQNMPPGWQVFQISWKKLGILLTGFCVTVFTLLACLTGYLLLNPDHHPTVPVSAIYIILFVMLFFVVITIFLSLLIWNRMRYVILIIMPEGLIRGDRTGRKNITHILFRDIEHMYRNGWSITLQMRDA